MKKAFSAAALKTIVLLAWPTVLEQILQTAVQYVDTAMVGSIGAAATAAVGATTTINWLVNSSISALSIGFLAYISRALGAKERENARRATAQACMVTLIVGIFFTILSLSLSRVIPRWMNAAPDILDDASTYFFILYAPMLFRTANIIFGTCLRAAGDTKTPLRVNILVNIVNIVLNYLLIYPSHPVRIFSLEIMVPGAGMGVAGAAIASAVSFAVGGAGMTLSVLKHPLISPKGCTMRPDGKILRPCLKVALPCALQRFGTSFGYVAFASMINDLGTIATAAHSIANTAESAFYIPGYGMQTATATLAGNALGAKDKKRMRDLTRMILVVETAMMIVSGGLLFAFAPNMMGLFSSSAEVILLGATVLRMVAVSEPFYGVSIVIEGLMQGVGKTVTPFVYNIIGMWGVRIVGTFICTQLLGMGLVSAWACMISHNLLLFVLFVIHYFSGKWNPLNQAQEA